MAKLPTPIPVVIAHPAPSLGQRVTTTRLGTPAAFLMLVGLVLVYYALHGWDRKYGTFNGNFATKDDASIVAVPSDTTRQVQMA
jgi:hypothetical protein